LPSISIPFRTSPLTGWPAPVTSLPITATLSQNLT
jgi:hypothetical protein